MLTFWIIAAVLTALAIAFVVPPLLKKNPPATDVDRNSLNVAIYKERLAELERENLTPEQLAQAKQELEKTLAQDLEESATLAPQPRARWATSIIVTLCIPALAIGVYWKVGAWELLTPAAPIDETAHPQSGDEMVNKLAARLQQEPNNKEGWYMLARSYTALKRYDDAARAYNKLLALVGDQDPQLLTDFASVLVLSNEGQFAGQPTILLKAALDLDPNHQTALWLSGFAAVQKNDYNVAIEHWQRLLQQIPPENVQARQNLEAQIANARHQLGGAPVPQAAAAAKIEVHVSLDPALQDKVKPNDTLFIYARATKGQPMPLAIVRKSASELPSNVTLDDSMAMMPSMKLSNFQEVSVLARISTSGNAMLQSGDLLGQVSPVVLDQQDKVEIVIDQVVE
ncbi:MAG: c-type cytochrome biogenesis protein CcmI [Pseudomonadota bacterium]